MTTTVTTGTLSSNTAITFDLSSLGSSSTFLSGRESNEVDNTATGYIDAIVNVKGVVGHASTAPTVGQQISIWVWGADTSLATTAIDVLDGADSAETLSHAAVLNALGWAAGSGVTVATAGLTYYFQPFSVAEALGLLVLPKFWGLFVSHNHTGALGASNSALFSFNGVTLTNT